MKELSLQSEKRQPPSSAGKSGAMCSTQHDIMVGVLSPKDEEQGAGLLLSKAHDLGITHHSARTGDNTPLPPRLESPANIVTQLSAYFLPPL